MKETRDKSPILYDSIYMKYAQQTNPYKKEISEWLLELGEGVNSDC
jgi:hypothetical protein